MVAFSDRHRSPPKPSTLDFLPGSLLAQAIVDTVRESLLVLDQHLCVVAASRSFYQKFQVSHQNTVGRTLRDLGDGQWNMPDLHARLKKILSEQAVLEDFEVELDVPTIGRRAMLLNAHSVLDEEKTRTNLLLAVEDVTERRAVEHRTHQLLQQKDLLLQEVHHRVANSLQIIASIIRLRAQSARSEETRRHLQDVNKRIMSVAVVQHHLAPIRHDDRLEMQSYLTNLCKALAESMIGDGAQVSLDVQARGGSVSSRDAVSIGLIVTECVINALKHAFPADPPEGSIVVCYVANGSNWELSISDDGKGKPAQTNGEAVDGLGSIIVNALAEQLEAHVTVRSGSFGTTVTLVHVAGDVRAKATAA